MIELMAKDAQWEEKEKQLMVYYLIWMRNVYYENGVYNSNKKLFITFWCPHENSMPAQFETF